MGNLRGSPAAAEERCEATGVEHAADERRGTQAIQALQAKSAHAFERYCHFHSSRSRQAEEFRRQRQQGQQANLHRILSAHYAQVRSTDYR